MELALKNYIESDVTYADNLQMLALNDPELYANFVYETIDGLDKTSKLLQKIPNKYEYSNGVATNLTKASILVGTVGYSSFAGGPSQKVFDLLLQTVLRLNEIERATGDINHYREIQQYLMQSTASCQSDPTDLRPEFVRNLCKKNNNPDYLIRNALGKYGSAMDKLLQTDLGKYGN